MPFLWWIKPGDKVHCSRFHRLCLSAVWCTQAKFCVDGHVTAESSKVESPVAAPGWHLQIFEQSLYFNKDFSVSLWTPVFYFFFTSAVDIQPISWLSVWGMAYFLVGSSRALWKALMKSAATDGSVTGHVWNVCRRSNSPRTLIRATSQRLSAVVSFVGVNSQFSSITSVGFFAMGLSGRMCTERRRVHTVRTE